MSLLLVSLSLLLAADQAELDAIAKRLRAKAPAERVKACEAAGKLGAEAKPLLRDLCQSALDPAVQQAALEAIGKVDANLFPFVTTLVIDKQPGPRVAAIVQLGKLKEQGLPALPVVYNASLRYIRGEGGETKVFRQVMAYIEEQKPNDPLTVVILSESLKTKMEGPFAALSAIEALAAGSVLRKDLLPLVRIQLQNPEAGIRSRAAHAAAAFGEDGKPLLSVLAKLQIDSDAAVRAAAGIALKKIEGK